MNDPNGLVFFQEEFHLFYQYNPEGIKWGHMSWGHAVSRDLVHWEQLALALPEANEVMVFPGSAVVDWQDTSGFGRGKEPPLVAIYTGHYTRRPRQNQNLAYSNDRERTWTKFSGNPVLDIGEADFRDPKVFWHEPTRRWVMAVSWPAHRNVRFYGSPNLRDWSHLSDFGPPGATEGIWECPDIFPVPMEGGAGALKWILIVNVNAGASAGGSDCQYFVGQFDGRRFAPDRSAARPGRPLWADWARDFYAAVFWNDVPASDGRRLWIGWMSNWDYAPDVPTSPWRNAMSLPQSLAVRETPDGWRLLQRPVRELESLRGQPVSIALKGLGSQAELARLDGVVAGPCELSLDAEPGSDSVFDLTLQTGAVEATTLRVDMPNRELTLDRTQSGNVGFHPKFAGTAAAPLRLIGGHLKLNLFVDTSSIEIFANNDEAVLSSLLLPSAGSRRLSLRGLCGSVKSTQLEGWKLASIWGPRNDGP